MDFTCIVLERGQLRPEKMRQGSPVGVNEPLIFTHRARALETLINLEPAWC